MTNEYSITLNFYQRPKIIMDYKIFKKKNNGTHFKYLKIVTIEFQSHWYFFFFFGSRVSFKVC